jgi:hypothetical protein
MKPAWTVQFSQWSASGEVLVSSSSLLLLSSSSPV